MPLSPSLLNLASPDITVLRQENQIDETTEIIDMLKRELTNNIDRNGNELLSSCITAQISDWLSKRNVALGIFLQFYISLLKF